MQEPLKKRTITFFDCQNLFQSAKNAWGYSYPNFEPVKLSLTLLQSHPDWKLTGIHLYSGIHSAQRNPRWNRFWNNKFAFHRSQDSRVTVFTTPLHYNTQIINGVSVDVASEKGVDIRIALDLVRMARLNQYDVAVLFSRDSDFREVALEIRSIAAEKNRWIKIASVFPDTYKRGIDQTDWLPLSRQDYEACIDTNDYR